MSSFFAAPDIVSDQRFSSGLVLEFQQYGGQLIAGGNTKTIRCWDIGTEKCHNTFDSKSGASLTTLTTAWNSDAKDGYSGIGPDIIVAGYGNGSLRVFDTRSRNGDPVMSMNDGGGHRNTATKRRWKCSEYDEHSNWIVDLSFTNYGGRHEVRLSLQSGCLSRETTINLFLTIIVLIFLIGCFWVRRGQNQILGSALFIERPYTRPQNANDSACSTFQCAYVCHRISSTIYQNNVS